MKLVVAPDYETLTELAADFIAETVADKPDAVLALPTGSTPLGAYRRLILKARHGHLDLSRVTTFNLDEYVGVGLRDPLSYHAYMT
ncbi:MAG: 6-phosphogluconolactonase [Bacillota bacterium]